MSKEQLIGKLQTIKNNYALAQACIMFLAQPDIDEKFDEYYSKISDHPEASFGYIKYVLQDYELLKLATGQFRKAVLRCCLKEMFEVLKFESETEHQKKVLKEAPWYQFLRMIRNSLSHDFHLRFSNYDISLLPVSWSGLTISRKMDGSELQMEGFFSIAKAQKLIEDVIEYVNKKWS